MIAPDPKLVRRLRGKVRIAVKASALLRRDNQHAVAARRAQGQARFVGRWLNVLARAGVTGGIVGATLGGFDPAAGSALLLLWTACITLLNAGKINELFSSVRALGVFYCLPAGNAEVFQHQASVLLRSSLWLGGDWLAFGLALAAPGGKAAWLVAPAFAVAQWTVSLGLAGLLTRWRRVRQWGSVVVFGTGLVVWVLILTTRGSENFLQLWHKLEPVRQAFRQLTPAGWLATAQANVLAGNLSGWLVALAVGGGGAALLWVGARKLRADFSLERIFGYGQHNETDPLRWIGAEEDPDAPAEEPLLPVEPLRPVDLPALREKLRDLLDAPPGLALFRRGWLESVATRALPERQRMLVDFLQPGGLRSVGGWKTALVLMAIAQAARRAGLDPANAAMLTAFALGCFLLPTFGGYWTGLANRVAPQGSIGFSAFFPVGLGEVARVLLTVNAVRAVAALPLLVLAMRFGFTATPLPWAEALGFALRTVVIVLALQPVWAVVAFSKCSNDSSAPGWLAKLLLLALVIGILTLPVFGVAMFFVQSGGKALVCAAALLGFSHGLLALYGWAWGRNFFDLVARPSLR